MRSCRRALSLATVDGARDMIFPEDLLGVEFVVRAATHAQVRSGRGAAKRVSFDVIELEPHPRCATPAVRTYERAALAVSFEDLATYGRRDLGSRAPAPRRGHARAAGVRFRRRCGSPRRSRRHPE